jgi:serine/threonine protein phosphatase 1
LASKDALSVKVELPENGGRRLVITDIHGCNKTLGKLLKKVGLTTNDQLFLLGDFINRGPRSKQVLDRVFRLLDDGYNVYPLMGNHEENLLHIAAKNPDELVLLLEPRNSLNLLNKKGNVRGRFFKFIRKLPYFYELDGYYLVHAGFNLNIKKPFADSHAMTWMRNFSIDKKLNGRRVLFGHTPTKISKINRAIENNMKSICLDNGCSHTYLGAEYGSLVCYDLDSKQLFKQKNID